MDWKDKPIVVHLVVNQKLWSLEVPTGNPHVVLLEEFVQFTVLGFCIVFFCYFICVKIV